MRKHPWKSTFKIEQTQDTKPCEVCGKPIKRGIKTLTEWNQKTTCSQVCVSAKGRATMARNKAAAKREADGL